MPDRQTAEQLFLEHVPWIDRLVAQACAKHRLWGSDAEEFAGWLRMRMMEDDYAIIRNFRGESGLRTYLSIVVSRQFHEWARQRWGRWRTSAEAKRLGPPAPELEALVHRDGYPLEQAAEKLRTEGRTDLSDAELARLLARLPPREPLRPVEVVEDGLLDAAESTSRADERVLAAEEAERRGRVAAALEKALEQLDPEDRIIVRMHLMEGCTLAHVARALTLEQKPLYRRVDRLRAKLRKFLEDLGVDVGSLRGEEDE